MAWLGIAGMAALSPAAALAADPAAAPLYGGGGLLLALLAAAGLLLARTRRQARHLAHERDRLAAALGASEALLGALPLALWRAQGGEESFLAGSLKALGDVAAPQLADVLARAERQDAAALEAAIADLGADGTAFQLGLRLADGRTQLDAVGRRVGGTDLVGASTSAASPPPPSARRCSISATGCAPCSMRCRCRSGAATPIWSSSIATAPMPPRSTPRWRKRWPKAARLPPAASATSGRALAAARAQLGGAAIGEPSHRRRRHRAG